MDTKSPDDEEVVMKEILPQENERENAQERDAQGDERDDTLMEKQQDMSGGFMPVPGLAGFIGAQAVTGDVSSSPQTSQ